MSKIVQWKRGNTNVNSTYTGLDGEITVNTDTYNLHVHDGTTPGGHIVGNDTGNLIFDNQTIQGTVSDANIILQPLDYGAIRSNAQFASFGLDARLFIQTLENSNVALITTTSRADGNKVLYLNGNLSRPAISVNQQAPYAVGINQVFSPGYTLSVNGSSYSTEFYAAADFPTGFQFTTPGRDTGFSHSYQNDANGNVSLIRIRHDNEVTAKFYDNLTTALTGNLTVSQDGVTFGSFPNAFVQVYADVNSYSQFVHQNLNGGELASADFVATANNGDDESYFVDLGIASNTYSYPGYGIIKPNDIYLLAIGANIAGPGSVGSGNLILGSTNGNINMFIGDAEDANIIAQLNSAGLVPGANVTYSLGSADAQWKDLWLSNSTLYMGGTPITVVDGVLNVNGSPISGNGGGSSSNYGDANVAAYLPTYTGNIAGNIVKNNKTWTFESNGVLTLPGDGGIRGTPGLYSVSLSQTSGCVYVSSTNTDYSRYSQIALVYENGVTISASTGNVQSWTFDPTGNLTTPGDVYITGGNTNVLSVKTEGGNIRIGNQMQGTFVVTDPYFDPSIYVAGQQFYITTNGNAASQQFSFGAGGSANVAFPGNLSLGDGADSEIINTGNNVVITASTESWTFGTDGNLTVPASSKITNGDGATITFNTNVARVATDAGFAYVEVQEQDLFLIASSTAISNGPYSWYFNPNGAITVSSGDWEVTSAGDLTANTVLAQNIRTIEGAVHIGQGAGLTNQGLYGIAVGRFAGGTDQGSAGLAIGQLAGGTSQGQQAIALGLYAGYDTQSANAVAIGTFAGRYTQSNSAIAVGELAGNSSQSANAVAIGTRAGSNAQSISAIAIGREAGNNGQGAFAVAVGWLAGNASQGGYSVAIGPNAGSTTQGENAVAIGVSAARETQGTAAVAIGQGSGTISQGARGIAIGDQSGQQSQSANAVAIGTYAGYDGAGISSISIGTNAGYLSQGASAIAIGGRAGNVSQGSQAVAIGVVAGQSSQGTDAVAIGSSAGASNQSEGAVAIGQSAGVIDQGLYAVAIGSGAGYQNQANNSIAITATGTQLSPEESGFYVDPVRNDVGNISQIVTYNTTTKEITYSNTISIAGNITAGNISSNVNGFAIGYRDIPQVVFTSNATLALTDAGKHYFSSNSANVITVPNNSTVSFSIGTAITVVQQGTANLTITPDLGVTMYLSGNSTSAARTLGNYGMATLMKVATDTWFINGTGLE